MYKKHKIIMLPSTKFPEVGDINLALYNSETHKLELIHYVINGDGLQPQHLYILSDDNIVEGDWCVDTASKDVFKADKELIKLINDRNITLTINKKIVATTNKLLKIKEQLSFIRSFEGEIPKQYSLPLIPEYFIKYYIEQYNFGNVIQEVEVFYNDGNLVLTEDLKIPIKYQWDIREQEYHKSQLKEKTYSRSEVVELLKKFEKDRSKQVWIPELATWVLPFDKWIEQNLK